VPEPEDEELPELEPPEDPPEDPLPPLVTGALAVRAFTNAEASDEPITLVATTVNEYVVPSASPVIVQVVKVVVHVAPPFAVTVYPVIEEPPSDVGAVQLIIDWRVPFALAWTAVGAPGRVADAATTEVERSEVPIALVAVTVYV
jgi:hypothetical protein